MILEDLDYLAGAPEDPSIAYDVSMSRRLLNVFKGENFYQLNWKDHKAEFALSVRAEEKLRRRKRRAALSDGEMMEEHGEERGAPRRRV